MTNFKFKKLLTKELKSYYCLIFKTIKLQVKLEHEYKKHKKITTVEILKLNNELSKNTILLNNHKKTLTEVKVSA